MIKYSFFRNGDVLAVIYSPSLQAAAQEEREIRKSTIDPKLIKQHPIDDLLEKQDGLIKGQQSSMCRHGSSGMCDYCMPVEVLYYHYYKMLTPLAI